MLTIFYFHIALFIDWFVYVLVSKEDTHLSIHDKLLQQVLCSVCTQLIKITLYSSFTKRYLCAGKILSDFRKEIIAFSKCYHICKGNDMMKMINMDNQSRRCFHKNTIIYIKCECFDLIQKANCTHAFIQNMLITSYI